MSDASSFVKKTINPWQIVFVIVGIGLLAAIMWRIDMNAVMSQVITIGWGILLVIGIYLMAFLCDTVSWRLVLRPNQHHKLSFLNLFNIRMVGAAWNKVTPIFGMAGEPIKAILLRRYHGVNYQEGAASLVVAKTANLIALVIFLASGLCLALITDALPPAYRVGATIALLMLTTGIGLLFLVQRFRLSSKSGSWLSRRWFGKPILRILDQMHALDERLAEAYTTDRRRFVMSVIMTLANWLLGVLELWFIMWLLDVPVTLTEAWCIEAVVELVRADVFYSRRHWHARSRSCTRNWSHYWPGPLGLAVSFIRRARELFYVLWGFGINWFAYRSGTKVDI